MTAVEVTIDQNVATVTLNDAKTRNALNPVSARKLVGEVRAA